VNLDKSAIDTNCQHTG